MWGFVLKLLHSDPFKITQGLVTTDRHKCSLSWWKACTRDVMSAWWVDGWCLDSGWVYGGWMDDGWVLGGWQFLCCPQICFQVVSFQEQKIPGKGRYFLLLHWVLTFITSFISYNALISQELHPVFVSSFPPSNHSSLQGDHLQLPFFISFWRALKNNEIIQLNHFCQPHIETFWYFEVSLWSGEKKSCLSRLCQNNVMAPYCKGWEPKTHLCASNFQK